MRPYLGLAVLLTVLISPGAAEDFVCGDATQLTRYLASRDPSTVTDGTCSQVGEAQIAAQRALLAGTPLRYLKVVGGLATEKSQAEKDAVDAALAAAVAAQQVFVTELATDTFCNATTLDAVNTRIEAVQATVQADIDAITNVATAKTAMTTMNTAYAQGFKKIMRCLLASRRTSP